MLVLCIVYDFQYSFTWIDSTAIELNPDRPVESQYFKPSAGT